MQSQVRFKRVLEKVLGGGSEEGSGEGSGEGSREGSRTLWCRARVLKKVPEKLWRRAGQVQQGSG